MAACEKVEEQVEPPLLLLVMSQLLMGASLSLYYAVAIPRLDRNVRRTQMPLYYGFLLMLRVMAPAICYVVWALVVPWGAAPPGGLAATRKVAHWCQGFLFLGVGMVSVGMLLLQLLQQLAKRACRGHKAQVVVTVLAVELRIIRP